MSTEPPATPPNRANPQYIQRIDRVIDHLRSHLDGQVRLCELARVAGFSEYHFHRIFGAVTGETLNNFTNRVRVEKAARLLRYSQRSITDIALDCGYSSSATFARAFRSAYQTTPSKFRKSGEIQNRKICKDLFETDHYHLQMTDQEKAAAFPVRLVELPERQVTYIRVDNAFEGERVLSAFKTLLDWARSGGAPAQGTLFGMSLDDPHVTPKHLYRYEVCLATDAVVEPGPGMSQTTMPATRYAVTTVSGDLRLVGTAWDYLYRGWLVHSAYEPLHAPALEIFLNKERATDWSHFELDLCLPVQRWQE